MKRKVSKNLRSVIGGRSFAARCLYLALAVCMAFIILSVTDVEAKSKKKYRLSYTSKTMERGEFYNISLKGVPKSVKAKKIKWKSSNKKVVSIYSKKKNRAVLRAKKCGNAKITAIYKGRKYTCKVTVVKDPEQKKADNPALNASSVVIHYLPDYAVPYIKKDAAYNYSFQFTVSGTDESVRSWSIEGDPVVAKRYHITDKGLLYKVFGDDDYRTEYTECTVKAELTNGKVLTAGIRGYDDVNIFIRNTISDFKKTYINDKMTEYEKMEKVAWYLSAFFEYRVAQPSWSEYLVTGSGDCQASRHAVMIFCRELGLKAAACPDFDSHGQTVVRADGKVYLVTTGFGNPKPRYYQINEITRADFDKINEKNFVDPAYIWGE